MFIRLRLVVFMLLGALTLLLAGAALAAEPRPLRWPTPLTRAQGVAAVARLSDDPRHAPPNGRQRWPGFILWVTPEQVDICRGNDAWFTVQADQMTGFSDAITLDVSGQPTGTGSSFAPNPLTPGVDVELRGGPQQVKVPVRAGAPGPMVIAARLEAGALPASEKSPPSAKYGPLR